MQTRKELTTVSVYYEKLSINWKKGNCIKAKTKPPPHQENKPAKYKWPK